MIAPTLMASIGMDYSLPRFSRHCAVSGEPLQEGEWYYSVLLPEGSDTKRIDISAGRWEGPPEEAIAWWKSQVPVKEHRPQKQAPQEVLWQFFTSLYQQQSRPEMLYVLTLLLLRRRMLRFEDEDSDSPHAEQLVVASVRDDSVYEVPVLELSPQQTQAIQAELNELLEEKG